MKLFRGDHCQCPTCGEYFNSTYAFDKHRTGRDAPLRRCLSPAEMRTIGIAVSSTGWWVSSMASNRPIPHRPAITGAAIAEDPP